MSNSQVSRQSQLTKHDLGWRGVVRNFTPSWFSVTMGTGIISVVVFAFNVLLLAIGYLITALRYSLYPEIFTVMITHPVQSMFLGAIPMSFATIVNMFCFVCVPAWGEWAKNFAWGMWIFDAVLSVITALSLPFLCETQLSSMTAVWLLPIVSCHALWTVIVSYALWGIGLPLAMMVMVIYLQRLSLHKVPPKAVIVSVFLPLGPLSQGSFGILKLGKAARTIFPQTHTLQASSRDVFYTVGSLVALILWAFALVWLFFALASIVRCKSFPFNIGWWGFTFPLGVFIVSLCVVVLRVVVRFGTLKGVVSGQFFVAPCLANLRIKEEDKMRPRMRKQIDSVQYIVLSRL
ncbi:voltage-dependent anion channel-domain-containing protein [Aspergillus transmontanensis]|uniref:Voltage-dependent anion channel-domain-containing protein n=1 Tax=Aspergillus transmontanensis TaxID=1034304 RepID=A0A5N6W5K1_9EURO|nr:voltage-dependent anion channel-domain-containing protein [Aspergillus transmontanensis]